MDLSKLTAQIKQKMALATGIKAKVRFDLGQQGCIFVDTTIAPALINHDRDTAADVTLLTSADVFEKILNGTQDPNLAFMTGKLKIKGSMALAMKLNSVLED